MNTRVKNVFLAAAMVAANFGSVHISYGQFNIGGKECSIGIRAGANFTKMGGDLADMNFDMEFTSLDASAPSKFKPGFQLGVVLTIPFNDQLMLQPGFVFAQQGAKWEASGSESLGILGEMKYSASAQFDMNYFQFPVNFIYRYDMSSSIALLLQAGPYLGYGIGGKMKMDMSVSMSLMGITENESENLKSDINFGGDKDKHHFKAADLGLGIGAGMLLAEKFQVSLGYNLGLADIGHYLVAKNRGFAFTLTYMLGK